MHALLNLSVKLICFYTVCAADDDYSDTYNASYALINSGEAFLFVLTEFMHQAFISSHRISFLRFCRQRQTTSACRPAPPWRIHQHGRTPTDLCPRAPRTTEHSSELGSHHQPLCLHRLHLCRPSSSCGPETVTARGACRTCRLKLFAR